MTRMFSTYGCLTVIRPYSGSKYDGLICELKQQQKENKGRYEGVFYAPISKPHKILGAESAIKINGSRFYCVTLFNFILSPFFFFFFPLPLFQFLPFHLPKLFGVPVFMSFISLIRHVGQNVSQKE